MIIRESWFNIRESSISLDSHNSVIVGGVSFEAQA